MKNYPGTISSASPSQYVKDLAESLCGYAGLTQIDDPLAVLRSMQGLGELAQAAQVVLASRLLAKQFRAVFQAHPDLDALEVELSSTAFAVDGEASDHCHEVDARVCATQGLSAEEQMNVEATMLQQGLMPEVIRTIIGLDKQESGAMQFSVTRQMVSPEHHGFDSLGAACLIVPGLSALMEDAFGGPRAEPPLIRPRSRVA